MNAPREGGGMKDEIKSPHPSSFTLSGLASCVLVLLLPLSVYWPIGPPVAPEVLDFYARPGLYLSDLAIGLMLLASLLGGQDRLRWGLLQLTWPLITLVGLAALTILTALSPLLAGYTTLRWLAAVAVYLMLLQNDFPIKWLVTLFIIGLGFHVLVGLGQVLKQGPLGLPGELALEPNLSGASIIPLGERKWLRAYGLTFHPNVLGGFLAVGLLLGLPLLTSLRWRLLWWLLSVGLLLSFSRSAWLATLLVLVPTAGWLAWRYPPLRRPLAVTLGGMILLAGLAGLALTPQLLARLRPMATVIENRSLVERGELQQVALAVIASQPLSGVGAGNFPLAVLATGTPLAPQPVHNLPLLLAAEVGIVGAGLWFWLWLRPGMLLERLLLQQHPWPVVVISAWLAWGIISLWDSYPWVLEAGRLLTVTLLGLTSQVLQRKWAGEQATDDDHQAGQAGSQSVFLKSFCPPS